MAYFLSISKDASHPSKFTIKINTKRSRKHMRNVELTVESLIVTTVREVNTALDRTTSSVLHTCIVPRTKLRLNAGNLSRSVEKPSVERVASSLSEFHQDGGDVDDQIRYRVCVRVDPTGQSNRSIGVGVQIENVPGDHDPQATTLQVSSELNVITTVTECNLVTGKSSYSTSPQVQESVQFLYFCMVGILRLLRKAAKLIYGANDCQF